MKDNYFNIEEEIAITTKNIRLEQHQKYQEVISKLESLKQKLKAEITERK